MPPIVDIFVSSTLYICRVRTAHQPLKAQRAIGDIAPETAEIYSMVNQKDQMVKISPAFLQRLIDTVCYPTQMYKVEVRSRLNNRWQSHFWSSQERLFRVFSCLLYTCGTSIDQLSG